MRMSRLVPRWTSAPGRAAFVLLMAVVVAAGLLGPARAQVSLFDPVFEEVRRGAAEWDKRPGPTRQVVDVVCLVPDTATFLEAISAWDEHHYFPVLIDDVEYTFKFLRAFHPTRVVRLPAGKPETPAPDALWDRAVAAVGRSWTAEGVAVVPRGDVVPKALGATPPGVVVSAPGSPALAGAVALAAGRFQPLLRWETAKKFGETAGVEEAHSLSQELEERISAKCPAHDRLGDDCDFVTLAGDYPFRYTDDRNQVMAFDDLILRSSGSHRRWAYAGRLMGGPVQSVYRAMCSLFLTPTTAVTFNTYNETDKPWTDYGMTTATGRLNRMLPTLYIHGPKANLAGWHANFDPVNRQGFVLLTSSGGDTYFSLFGGVGHTSDIPESVPTAVLMTHSFSAGAPENPDTLAARWLQNGAFIYYGAMNEPYLQAFRSPTQISAFLEGNMPVSVAARRTAVEPFGQPWRLVYLGDPLWRIKPVGPAASRLATWEPVASWPAYTEYRQPEAGTPEGVRLNWAIKTAIFRLQAGAMPRHNVDLAGVLLGIDRARLEPRLQAIDDALLVDTLLSASRVAELVDRLTRIPPASRSRDVRRHLETAQTAVLIHAATRHDFRQALALWNDVMRAKGSRDFVPFFTQRVGLFADSPLRLGDWRDRLRSALHATTDPEVTKALESELKRLDEAISTGKGR
jgi:hypothetical protein